MTDGNAHTHTHCDESRSDLKTLLKERNGDGAECFMWDPLTYAGVQNVTHVQNEDCLYLKVLSTYDASFQFRTDFCIYSAQAIFISRHLSPYNACIDEHPYTD